MTYQPRVGDRVRATQTVEGVVTANVDGEHSYVAVRTEKMGRWELHDEDGWSLEKLQDPEPEWVHGDYIKLEGGHPEEFYFLIRMHQLQSHGGHHWEDLYGNIVNDDVITREWNDGTLKILYKADGKVA